ncbi:multisubunit potassium/proton antiporter, PhaE subunit [Thiomicrospira sp. ALE5]|nr:multisubunit potassium/proton antiporter, PhaE subunit [Thiomicrospira sp. ALE5]
MMLKRVLPHPILSFILWIAWLLLNNTVDPGHMVLGAILAIFIPWFTAAFWPEKIKVQKPAVLAKFFAVVLWDIMVANFAVAKLILGRNDKLQPGFFEVPLEITTPIGISILANTISLTPGTVSCDLSPDQTKLIIHALHIDDQAQMIADIKQRYERPLKEVFVPC